jgi:hypothetical protein
MENYALVRKIIRNINKQEYYRGTNLLNSGYKIYANIVKNKLYDYYYHGKSGEDQNGFQRGRKCADGYCSLNLIVEKHTKFLSKPPERY